MVTEDQVRQFNDDGFVVVPNVLTRDQVTGLRTLAYDKLGTPEEERLPANSDRYLFDVFNRYPEFRWVLAHEPILSALRGLLGPDFVVVKESAVHLGQFGGWHKDTTAQEREGLMFQWARDYLMVEVALYLQDNDPVYAGGLDVEPGSHRTPDHFAIPGGRSPHDDAGPFHTIPSKAGDLVVFDLRINHRATQPQRMDFSPEQEKLALFFVGSTNSRHVETYERYISGRGDYAWLHDFSYDEGLLELAREHDIVLS